MLSKRGLCSRTEAARWILGGRIAVDGRIVRDPEFPTLADAAIALDGQSFDAAKPVYIALNKPRGLVTTASDERARQSQEGERVVRRQRGGDALQQVGLALPP